jgi:putative aldouronate transport system substrate-binding protein
MKKIIVLFIIISLFLLSGKEPFYGDNAAMARLTVMVFDRGTDGGRTTAINNAWTDWIKEKVRRDLNIDVTFIPVNRWQESIDMIHLMNAVRAPDLCYTYNFDILKNYSETGAILNLAPYIDTHLPDLKILLGDDPARPGTDFIYRNADPQTGAIYSIPSYRASLAQRNIFIRKDWLDILGLPVPGTIDEFYNALKAFRDRDPGNLGRNRIIPFGLDDNAHWGLADLINHHIDPDISDRNRWIYNIADRYLMMSGYKEGVRLMNRWYNEGLIYRDFYLSTERAGFYDQIKSGVIGAFCQNWDLPYMQDYRILEDLRANVPGADLIPIDIVRNREIMDKVGLQIFIPAFSKNHEAALRYLNWLAIPENYQFMQLGRKGIDHENINGIPSPISRPAGDPWFMNSAYNIDYTMPMNGIELGSNELNARFFALNHYYGIPANNIVNAYETSLRNGRAPAAYNEKTTVTQYHHTLQEQAKDILARSIRAKPDDFDRTWDTGIRDWLSSGAQEVINERSRLYR